MGAESRLVIPQNTVRQKVIAETRSTLDQHLSGYLGRVIKRQADVGEVRQQGLEIWASTGTRLGTVLYGFMQAEVYTLLGRDEEAETHLRAALQAARSSEERVAEAEVLRLLGQLYRRRNQRRRAAQYYRNAIALARAQGAVLWRHRAQADLARV